MGSVVLCCRIAISPYLALCCACCYCKTTAVIHKARKSSTLCRCLWWISLIARHCLLLQISEESAQKLNECDILQQLLLCTICAMNLKLEHVLNHIFFWKSMNASLNVTCCASWVAANQSSGFFFLLVYAAWIQIYHIKIHPWACWRSMEFNSAPVRCN